MFRLCNWVIVRLFNRDHQIDYIIGGFFGGVRGGDEISPYIIFSMLLYIILSILLHIIIMTM